MLEVRSIRKEFGDTLAVDDVSFRTGEGQIFGLIGPNGAGKTTIIRMIMSILLPDAGEIFFDGRKLREEDKRIIGYLPEERGLYKKIKVNEMLLYLADLKDVPHGKSQKNIDYWLDRFGLMEWKDRKIEELSKGMSQKVQFIASIAHDPEILFFDEPFTGLDPVSSDMLRDSILDLGRQGRMILFSTHNMENAERICSHILLMDKGREVVSGSVKDLKDRYGTRTVVLEYDGQGDFIKQIPGVAGVNQYPRWLEIELAENASADELLAHLVRNISIRRFEIASPSLHKIFVDLMGGGRVQTDE